MYFPKDLENTPFTLKTMPQKQKPKRTHCAAAAAVACAAFTKAKKGRPDRVVAVLSSTNDLTVSGFVFLLCAFFVE